MSWHIDHQNEYIFIHNYKVAGISIQAALDDRNFNTKVLNHIKSEVGNLFGIHKLYRIKPDLPAHANAMDFKNEIPDLWNRYYTFAFVRNPWDWQVSLYEYMLETPNHFQHELIKNMDSFEEYIHWRVDEDKHLQKDRITNESGEIIVDFVGKLENIEDDFATICDNVGIKQRSLPKKNQSSRSKYQDYYTEETKDIILNEFKEDIEMFEYSY